MVARVMVRCLLPAALLMSGAGVAVMTDLVTHRSTLADTHYPVRLSRYDLRLAEDINRARARAHRASLALTAGTTDVARNWSCAMARKQRLAHRPDLPYAMSHHGSPNWTVIGENVGVTGSTDPDILFTAYMRSAEHRANILDHDYRYLGIHTTRSGDSLWNSLDFVDSYSDRYGPTRSTC